MARLLTGLELNVSSAKMVQIYRDRHVWKIAKRVEVPFPSGTLDMSNKSENVLDPEEFLRALREALRSMDGKVGRIGLSLPSEIIKISIHTWDELPKSGEKIREIIQWKEKDLLPFPIERARTSFFHLNGMRPGKESLLVAVGSEDIIRNYEVHLRSLRMAPEIVQPSAINHLNFYLGHLPSSGIVAFLGILEDYFAFFVFEKKELIFYRGKRKPSVPVRLLQEIAMTMQLCQEENPGKSIDTVYIQSQVPLPEDFYSGLNEDFRTASLSETDVIATESGLMGKTVPLAQYASAIGAAQSLED